MSWLILLVGLLTLIGVTEKSGRATPTRVRSSRLYQGGRRRVIGIGSALRGRQPQPQSVSAADLIAQETARTTTRRQPRTPITYTAPPPAAAANGASPIVAAGGVTIDFFQGLLTLVNAPYEGPNDALRQIRSLGEGARQWNNGLTRLHQRMTDTGDMRIDPFVSDHVLAANSYFLAGLLELVEADTAMTALLNMTLAQLAQRHMQIPNTK